MIEYQIIQLAQTSSYIILFLLFMVEGPVVNFIASTTAAATNTLNIFIIAILAILGDTFGDIIYYTIGRKTNNKFVKNSIKILENNKIVKESKKRIKNNLFSFLFIIKALSITAVPGILYVGHNKISFKRFLVYTLILAIIFDATLSFFAYNMVVTLNQFLNFNSLIQKLSFYLVLAVALILIMKLIISRLGKNLTKKGI